MKLLITKDLDEFCKATEPFRKYLEPLGKIMDKEVQRMGPLGSLRVFQNYTVYWRWPIRQLEYSFVLRNSLPLLENGVCTLDVGCGVTPLAVFFAQQGSEAYAIDPDCTIIEILKKEGRKIYGQEVHYSCQDATRIDFEDTTFDLITCVSTLEHLKPGKDREAVGEMLRVLKPGGRLILTVDFSVDCPKDRLRQFVHKLFRGFELVPSWQSRKLYCKLHFSSILRSLQGRRSGANVAYTLADIRSFLIRPFEKYFVGEPLQNLQIAPHTIRKFWKRHWRPGCLYDKNGRDYVSVGLIYQNLNDKLKRADFTNDDGEKGHA